MPRSLDAVARRRRAERRTKIAATIGPGLIGLSMNTRVPPFDDERVRQAVSYAIDRRTAAEFFGESKITCQILPPNFAGYRPYCPYTRDPEQSGEWTAPDLGKARQLVEASGAAGAGDRVDFPRREGKFDRGRLRQSGQVHDIAASRPGVPRDDARGRLL